MKKLEIFFAVLLCFLIVFSFAACDSNTDNDEERTTIDADFEKIENIDIPVVTEEVKEDAIVDYQEKEPTNSQVGVIVNSWLKVVSIGERNGKLSVFVRNISEKDVQYAVLSVVCGEKTHYFTFSTLTAGSSAIITCDNAKFDEKSQYHTWKINDEIIFKEPLSVYPEVFEISGADGCISIKNISSKSIDGPIYVYYKNVEDGVFTEGTTYRISVEGLKKNEEIQVLSAHYKKDTSLVMFVTYAE